MPEEISITPSTKEELWKFSDGSLKNIYEMTLIEVFTCTIHALKRIRHWTKQARWNQYKIETTYNDQEKEDSFHYHKTRCNNNIHVFATKLEALNERSEELGEDLPEKFEDVKTKLSAIKKNQKEKVDESNS